MKLIRFPMTSQYKCTVKLDGIDYQFFLSWSTRERAYYLAVSDSAGDRIGEAKLLIMSPVLQNTNDPRIWPGVLVPLRIGSVTVPEIPLYGIGVNAVLIYLEASEL